MAEVSRWAAELESAFGRVAGRFGRADLRWRMAGTAAAVLNTGRQVGGAIAVAVFGALLAGVDTFLAGMRWSMLIAAAGLVLTAGATLTLPRDGRREEEA